MSAIVKTPSEVDSYFLDFVNQLSTGETISTSSVTAYDVLNARDATAQIISTSPAPSVSGTQVIFWYQGGTVNGRYIIAVKVTTSLNRALEGDVDLLVKQEVPS